MPSRRPSARRTFRLAARAVVLILILTVGVGGFLVARAATFTDQTSVPGNTFTVDTLDPPTGLTASVVGTDIQLDWTPTVDTYATGYKVLRDTSSGGPYTEIGTVTPYTATTYTDSTVSPGTVYYYVLQTYSPNWLSVYSSEADMFVQVCDGLACDNFESGGLSGGSGWLWGWWNEGDSAVTTSGTPYEGSYHLRLRSWSGYVDRALDLSGQSGVHLQFWAKVNSFEFGDSVDLLVGPSASMTVVKTWTDADDDNTYHLVDVDLSPYTMSSEFYVAFDAEMSSTLDYFYVDDLIVKVIPPPDCTTYTSTDVPKAITDFSTITSTLTVSDSFTLTDVNVGPLSITHTYDADLDVYLISPAATQVELFTDVGGSGNNFTDTILDDEAATAITSGSAPFTGTYRPEGSLSALDGETSAGVWELRITDDALGDTGNLSSWKLELCK